MHYYYLDGLDKKGPYNPDELKSRNITPDTLVFQKGMTNWKSIKEIPELNSLLFKVQNDPPTNNDSFTKLNKQHINETTKRISNDHLIVQEKTKKIKVPSLVFLLIGILAAVGFSYVVIQEQQLKDKKDIDNKIEQLFQGKDEICDFQKTGVEGTLQDVIKLPAIDRFSNWELYKNIVEYYKCTSGGFTVQTLTKRNRGFQIVASNSTNMGFKVPASRYVPGNESNYILPNSGYYVTTNRGTIQDAYDAAMDYLSKDKENKSYVAGAYGRISTFYEISSDFYYIANLEKWGYSKSLRSSSVYTDDWIVWYSYNKNYYEILENENFFKNQWSIYSAISSVIILFIYFLIRYRRRISIQIL